MFKRQDLEVIGYILFGKIEENENLTSIWSYLDSLKTKNGLHLTPQDIFVVVNVSDAVGWTPLMMACWKGKVDIVKELLNMGASSAPCITDLRGYSVIDMARKKDFPHIEKVLLEWNKMEYKVRKKLSIKFILSRLKRYVMGMWVLNRRNPSKYCIAYRKSSKYTSRQGYSCFGAKLNRVEDHEKKSTSHDKLKFGFWNYIFIFKARSCKPGTEIENCDAMRQPKCMISESIFREIMSFL